MVSLRRLAWVIGLLFLAAASYGGWSGNFGAVYVNGSSPTLSNLTLQNNNHSGITVNNGMPTLLNSTFTNNAAGSASRPAASMVGDGARRGFAGPPFATPALPSAVNKIETGPIRKDPARRALLQSPLSVGRTRSEGLENKTLDFSRVFDGPRGAAAP